MKVTNVSLYSNALEVANFSFRDPNSKNPYTAVAIVGLDADEIVSKFYGTSKVENVKFNLPSLVSREVILRIALNPNFSLGKTYSDLRDTLYRAIASSRTGVIQLRFNNGYATTAALSGSVTKFEAPHFSETAEVQITMRCDDPMLRAIEPVLVDEFMLSPASPIVEGLATPASTTVDDPFSTAPHGFAFNLTLNAPTLSFVVKDAINPAWTFTITPGVIGADTGFLAGDQLYFSSETNDKYLYILRGDPAVTIHLIDKIVPGSIWPILFPGGNDFEVVSSDFDWNAMSYYPAYWGV